MRHGLLYARTYVAPRSGHLFYILDLSNLASEIALWLCARLIVKLWPVTITLVAFWCSVQSGIISASSCTVQVRPTVLKRLLYVSTALSFELDQTSEFWVFIFFTFALRHSRNFSPNVWSGPISSRIANSLFYRSIITFRLVESFLEN